MGKGCTNQFAALQAITAELVVVHTPAAAAHAVLTHGLAALSAAAGSIRLLSDDGTALVLLDREGYSEHILAALQLQIPLAEDTPICRATREGRPIYLANAAAYTAAFPGSAPAHAASGYAAAAALPLKVDGRTLGVLALSYADPQHFASQQRAFAQTLADLVAQALDRTRLYEAEQVRATAAEELARLRQEQAATAQAVAEVALALNAALEPARLYEVILEQATRVLPADHATIALYALGMATFTASRGVPRVEPGTVVEIGSLWVPGMGTTPAYIADTEAVPHWHQVPPLVGVYRERSIISVPLTIEGALVGSFDVSSRTPHRYSEQHLLIAAQFGVQATQALHNARLYAAEQERTRMAEELAAVRQEQAAEAAALEEVGAALNASLDVMALYTCILEQAAQVLPCDSAIIVRYAGEWAIVEASLGEPRPASGTQLFLIKDHGQMWMPDLATRVSYLPDTALEPTWRDIPPWVGADRRRSILSMPLQIDGVLLGFFSIACGRPHAYGEHHWHLAGLFAERALQALRNARLYAAERERADAAEELARLRSEFVATVSHELRTPLAAILGYAELLQRWWDHYDDAKRRKVIDHIVIAANRQLRLVEDLLLFSRLDDTTLAVDIVAIDVGTLVHRAAEEIRAVYRGQHINLEGPPNLAALADADRMVQVVSNLIDNAAKYSPEARVVGVSWSAEDDAVIVRVRDHGPGVPDENRHLLFTRFGRLPGSRMRAGRVGTGLGLYLSRQIARAMNGEIELEQTGPAGSTFRLRLPRAREMPVE